MTKRKPQTIEVQTSKEWVYQHETFFKVILKNYVGELNEAEEEELKEEMLEAIMNFRLKRCLKKKFGNKVEIEIEPLVPRVGAGDKVVKAIVKKKTIRERVSEKVESLKERFNK